MKLLKKIACIIIILILLLSNTVSLATKLNSEIANIIEKYYEWTETEDCKKDKNGQVNKTAAANKLIELCKSDSDKLNALYANYTDKQLKKYGGAYGSSLGWPGGSTDNIICSIVSIAINNVKNGADSTTTEKEPTINKDEIKAQYQKAQKEDKLKEWKKVDQLIKSYVQQNGQLKNETDQDIIEYAKETYITLKEKGYTEKTAYESYQSEQEQRQENNEEATSTSTPMTGTIGQSNPSSSHTTDEVIKEADSFITAGQNEGAKIDAGTLKKASNTLYNILLVIGIFLAVAIGMYLGIKFMLSSAEDRAKVKESLVPYIAGCVVIFGAFIIWKLAIILLGNLA